MGKFKFDVAIGNPPYQEDTNGAGRQAKPIYNLFIEQVKSTNPAAMTFIIPSRWFAGGMGLDKFRNDIMNDKHISKLVDYTNAKDCFPDNSIGGGVCFFTWNKNYDGDCKFSNVINGETTTMTRPLNEFPVLVRYNEAIDIIRKVRSFDEPLLADQMSSLMPFGLNTSYRGKETRTSPEQLALYASGNSITYIDRNVAIGNVYTYTVRCLTADGSSFTSDYLPGKSVRYLTTPHITEAAPTERGMSVRWTPVNNAVKYRLYVRSGNTWKRLTDTAATSYVHEGVTSAQTYTVRCINEDGTAFESDFDAKMNLKYRIAAPVNLKAQVVKNTVRVSWTPSINAARYRVFVYGAGDWTRAGETAGTSVTLANLTSGTTYIYTVRCISADGKTYVSDFDHDGVAVKYTDTPVLKAAENTNTGVKISWKASPGAEQYRVYYKGNNGWTKMGETTSTSYTDTDVISGKTFRYTVRCLTADGKSFTSDFDGTGVSTLYVAAPKLRSMDAERMVELYQDAYDEYLAG